MSPALLVLAAGQGSRYGGLKQIDPVGPAGETLLDYSVFDALRAGFGRIVFVLRRDFEAAFRAQVGAKYAGRAAVDYVFQEISDLPADAAAPAGRTKPWGTGHAVWCARAALDGPFAVINADDFYGADSFAQLGRFLQSPAVAPRGFDPMSGHRPPRSLAAQFALIGFSLARTLSEHGAVSRGICALDPAGRLRSITERTGILAAEVGAGRGLTGAETVSMNCWGFTPALFPALDRQFREFLAARGGEAGAEFYLPAAVSAMIAQGGAAVKVLPTADAWFGVTYREDKPRATAAIGALVAAGRYPAPLWP